MGLAEQRLKLHDLLKEILTNVYFQPPSNTQIVYPCIIYSRSDMDEKFADNILYLGKTKYLVTLIDSDPDSNVLDKLAALEFSSFIRHFNKDGLNHDIFSIYI